MAIDWSGLPESIRQTGDQISEEAYVAKRMSETLAEVYMTIIGDDAEEAEGNAIDKVLNAAQVLRMEVELYRAAASAHTIGEDVANVAMGEREAFEAAFRSAHEFPEQADQVEFLKGWQAGIMFARAALTAEKVAGQEAVAWFIADDNGEVYRATGYEHERDQWRAVGHAVFPLYAAPQQPAQPVAQTLALTDEQREAIEYAVRWMDENVSNRYAHTAAKELRALLAAQPASSLAEGGERE